MMIPYYRVAKHTAHGLKQGQWWAQSDPLDEFQN